MNRFLKTAKFSASILAINFSVASITTQVAKAQVAAKDEIIVSARKRPEKLLDISGSVQVLNKVVIDDYNLDELDNVIDFVPNATFNAAPSGTPVLAIRGLGTRPGSALLEQDVGLFVDGVWLGRNNQLNSALIDVQQIEVLKGTQATLYGRNTLAGAVSVQTVKPGDQFEGYIKSGYEFNFDTPYVEGAVTLPVSDNFSLRLASKYEDQGGYVKNTVLDRDEASSENFTVRGTGVYSADNGLKVTGRVQYTDRDRDGNTLVREEGDIGPNRPLEFTPSAFPNATLAGFDQNALGRQVTAPGLDLEDVGSDIEFFDWSLTVDAPLGEHTLTSITARSTMDLNSVFDVFLRSPGPRIIGFFDEDYSQFTQEVRLTSPGGRKLDYIVGAFYLDQNVERLTFQYVNENDRFWSGIQNVESYSVFANGTYSFTDSLRLVGGARLTNEDKKADIIVHGQLEPDGAFGAVVEKVDTTFVTGSATLEFDVNDTFLVYAGYSRGSKTPGLADGAAIPTNAGFLASPTVFIPKEDVDTYEAGFKWEQSNGFINATGFVLDVSDFQNASFIAGEIVVNSFDINVKGIEIDTFHRLGDNFSVTSSFGFLDGNNADTGGKITSAPSFSANGSIRYETDELIPGVTSRASFNVNHTSSHFLNAVNVPNNQVGNVTLLNANLGFTHQDSGIDVSVFVKNITDKTFQDFSFNAPFTGSELIFSAAPPRTVGIELGVAF